MTRTTRKQREALKAVFDRGPIYTVGDRKMTYRQFRRTVCPTVGCDDAIVVPWAGMWLAIEADGYIHS